LVIAGYSDDGEDTEIKQANTAMHEVKNKERNSNQRCGEK